MSFPGLPSVDGPDGPSVAAVLEGLRRLYEALPDGLLVADHAGRVVHVNARLETMSGYPAGELVGQEVEVLVPERLRKTYRRDRGAFVKAPAVRLMAAGRDFSLRRKDGSELPVDIALSPLRAEDELLTMSVIRDATERRRAEERVREAEARYRSVFENAVEGICVTSPEGRFLAASPSLARMLGYESPEALIASVPDAMAVCVDPEARRRMLQSLPAGGTAIGLEHQAIRKDGSAIWVSESIKALQAPDGSVAGFQGLVMDITERKRAQEALRRRDAILEAVAFAAERFLSAPTWAEFIEDVLARLGEAAQVSRVYVFQNHTGDGGALLTSQRYEWAAPGITPQIDNPEMQSLPWVASGFGSWADALASGQSVSGHVREMSEAEQRVLEAQQIRSILQAPLFVGGEWWGYLGVDQCDDEREFSPAETDALKTAAGALAAAIGRELTKSVLRETEARYRTLVEQISAVTHISRLDETASTIYISPQVEAMIGYAPEEWVADPDLWVRLLHPEDKDSALEANLRQIATGEPFGMEYRMVARDGRVVWVREETTTMRDERGEPLYSQGVWIDITDRMRAEGALRESEASLSHAQRIAHLGSWEWDIVANTVRWSDEIYRIFGLEPQEFGATYEAFLSAVHPDDRALVEEAVSAALEGQKPYSIDHRIVLPDGSERIVHEQAEVALGDVGVPVRMVGTTQDMTERKQTEEELKESLERLRQTDAQRKRLVARLVQVQEEERARIASDIHDDPLQKIAAVGMRLGMLKRSVLDAEQRIRVEELERTVSLTADSLRHLLFELRPLSLDQEGLVAAIREYLDQSASDAGFTFSLVERLTDEPAPEIRALCYRIAQEALANVKTHAAATQVEVLLESQAAGVHVTIRDDGIGFHPDALRRVPGHLGLPDMRERAELSGGWLRIDSAPGVGTTVDFWIPAPDPQG